MWMKQKVLKNKSLLLVTILIGLILSTSFVPISLFPEGSLHIVLQILKGLLLTMSWVVLYFLIKVSFFERYEVVYKKDVPRIILSTTKFIIFVCAFLCIVVFVLGESILSILTLGGLVSAGLTFALGELILDAFSGVILETESPFELNDWIKTLDGAEGRVIKINWRTVILENMDGYIIVVPHRKIAQGFTNYSKPHRSYWDSVKICLDHTVPVERAERILRAGVMSVASVYQKKCDVAAMKADKNGITYEVRYLVSDIVDCRDVKHEVINALTKHLHTYKLRISEVLGEYALSKQRKSYQEESPLILADFIEKVECFNELPKATVKKLAENAKRWVFTEGEVIVNEGSEGQSMFIIGEGFVEVSVSYKNRAGDTMEKKLFCLGYPEYFGEMALLLNEKRSATVTAVTNAVVYEISQELLKQALIGTPKALTKLTKQAIAKREANKLTKSQMGKFIEKKVVPSNGLLSNFKRFFQ